LKQWWDRQQEFFLDLLFCNVRLFCEFSTQGRFHFHGTIKISSPYFYLRDVGLLNANGACEMDVISHPEVWLAYCLKNQLFMQHYVKKECVCSLTDWKDDPFFTLTNDLSALERAKQRAAH